MGRTTYESGISWEGHRHLKPLLCRALALCLLTKLGWLAGPFPCPQLGAMVMVSCRRVTAGARIVGRGFAAPWYLARHRAQQYPYIDKLRTT
ncbi:hypothetical protein BD311DRAFT_199906 [Dichomitus squalens]|uniref:Uncharacterized protein n=1 Tax=Dichomitus squalens TaxID=114155 RepID=A0A4Q9N7V8_9APHY|nr:hypothetical protein BD311DRAFT_199906 [Dichomitus squalens]